MKIVFFGTANVALPIMEVLNKQHQLLAVVTTPDVKAGRKQEIQESPVSALAKDLKLESLKPLSVKNNPDFFGQLKALDADIFVVVAYGKILPSEIINLPKLKTINIHFSALPKYRGPSPIQAALLNGDQQTGTSTFVLDEDVDHGALLSQEIVDISPDDNYFTLSDKLAKHSAKSIIQVLEDYATGVIVPLPQDDSRATMTKIITKQDGRIDWQKKSEEIYNQFKAFYLWPGIWTTWNGQNLKITECFPSQEPLLEAKDCGTVLPGGAVSAGGASVLQIKRLQLEGKTETDIQSFLNGYPQFIGGKLGM